MVALVCVVSEGGRTQSMSKWEAAEIMSSREPQSTRPSPVCPSLGCEVGVYLGEDYHPLRQTSKAAFHDD